jgi:hypothetical protein
MKKIFFAAMFFCLLVLPARLALGQGYVPDYYYDPPYGTPYGDPRAYDPYYELHALHYQLYLNPYQYQSYPYYVAPPIIARPARPPIIVSPMPRRSIPRGNRR